MPFSLNHLRALLLSGLLLALFSCSSGDNSQSESFSDISEVEEEAAEAQPVPLLVLSYSVESFDTWNSAFEEGKSERESFDLFDLGFLVSAEDPRRVSVILRSTDHEKSREYASSESLEQALADMGAIGEPSITYMDALKLPEKPVSQRYRMMITHEVQDYDHWKEVFDQHDAERADAGLELIGIAHATNNKNLVSVMFAFEDMNAAKIFAASDELKDAMQKSGVISDPELTWFEKPSAN